MAAELLRSHTYDKNRSLPTDRPLTESAKASTILTFRVRW